MILSLETRDRKITVEVPVEQTIEDLFEHFKVLVIGAYFTEAAWEEHILDHGLLLDELRREVAREEEKKTSRFLEKISDLQTKIQELTQRVSGE